MASQPLLSIGMIVKNESRCLEKCLKALEPLRNAIPCELVIADTGSTDNTKEIASKYADTLFDFTWVNDFSKARNAVIERCNGKWYLSIDADEYLQSEPIEIVKLVKESYPDKNHAFITIRDYSSDTLQGMYSDFSALRITRLDKNTRFVNPIHERFKNVDINNAITLLNTVFAHDGYANPESDFVKKKMRRNLELLEIEYNKNPNDTSVVLQLLESAHIEKTLKQKYATLAMNHISELDRKSVEFSVLAPAIARKAIQYAVKEDFAEVSEWLKFAKHNFAKSYYYSVDITYLEIQWYIDNNKYEKAIEKSNDYFKNLEIYLNDSHKSQKNLISSIQFAHAINKNSVLTSVADINLKLKKDIDAVTCLDKVDLMTCNPTVLGQWISLIKLVNLDSAKNLISTHLTPILDNSTELTPEQTELQYCIKEYIKNEFSNEQVSFENCNIYSSLSNTFGISAKIVFADNKNEIQNLINEITDWQNLLPAAFSKALFSEITFPEEFYNTPTEKQQELLENVGKSKYFSANLIAKYFEDSFINNFNQLSFSYNLITSVWASIEEADNESKATLKTNFYDISRLFLTNLYNPEILENNIVFSTLSSIHRFSIYFIMAIDSTDMKEKIAYLHSAIKQDSSMKKLITFATEELKKENEQNQAKKQFDASPELLALAKNIKLMLDNYPENSPELIAIKQSPVYKQVAHLIENL